MINRISIILMLVFYLFNLAASPNHIGEEKENIEKDVNEIVEVILDNYSPLDRIVVVLDKTTTAKLYEDNYGVDGDIISVPPLQSHYSPSDFTHLVKIGVVDSIEAHCMYSTINLQTTYKIDSTIISKPLCKKKEIADIIMKYNRDAYSIIHKKYGKGCWAEFGTPLFNQDLTKAVILVDKYCARLNALGSILVLEKKNGKWEIVYEAETWVS